MAKYLNWLPLTLAVAGGVWWASALAAEQQNIKEQLRTVVTRNTESVEELKERSARMDERTKQIKETLDKTEKKIDRLIGIQLRRAR